MSTAVKRAADEEVPLAKRPKMDGQVSPGPAASADAPAPATDVQLEGASADTTPAAQTATPLTEEPVASSSGAHAPIKRAPDPNSKRSQRKADKRKDKGKDKDKDGRQPWTDRRRGTRAEDATEDGEPREKAPRLPKRMCAVLIGFCGSGYNGMQMCV